MPSPNPSLPALLPGFTAPTSYAAWPVWSGSTRAEAHFQPMPKKAAVRLWHRARDFDRQTKRKGRRGGAVGPTALQVLHALAFDFLNPRSGRLDPSHAAIARRANVCERAVAAALKRLRALGMLGWARRCAATWRGGRYVLEQRTNAYALLPPSQWRGYREPPAPPPPAPGTWGEPPPLPPLLAQAAAERRAGGTPQGAIGILGSDPSDALALALARLGRAVQAGKPQ